MNNYISLHNHSDFSPQDGAQSVKMIAEKAAKLGMNSVALTDHGRCGGLLTFKKACEKVDIKPILGLESYISPREHTLKEKISNHIKTSYHLTLLAKNEIGLRNLFRLTSIGWTEGFYYKARVSTECLKDHSEGLVVLSGCGAGQASQMILQGDTDRAVSYLETLRSIFKDDFYMEVQNHNLEWQLPLKKILFELSDQLDIPIMATQDSHYSNREDADMHRAICRLAAGDLEFEGDESYFKSCDEMKEMFLLEEHHAIYKTQEVADKCKCEWDYSRTIWPVFPLPAGQTPEQELRKLSLEGFNERFPNPTKEYTDRLEYELEVIIKMGFPTYFLVVQDFINWAKSQEIPVGPGRGSGAGSIVAYCLGITGIDPIKYGLYFQRFLNPSRVSNPDFDIDMCKERREEVIQYVRDKYESNKVAQIGTYSVFKPRGSLRDFARVLGYPQSVGEELANMIPPNIAGKTLKFNEVIKDNPSILKTKYPDVVNLAIKAEGLIRQAGIHAAGVLISDSEIMTQVPLFKGKNNEVVSQFDMHDVEEIGLVKYDFLGLKNLTVIANTTKAIKKYHNIDIDIDNIEEDNQKIFEKIFQSGKLNGVFQFETSSGFKDLCVKVKPTSISDLSAITSLFRPGPLGSKMTDTYVNVKNGETPNYITPELEDILKETESTLIYQEQIMRICQDIAGYTLAGADLMRRAIGKKIKEKMELEKDKFINGCIVNNFDKEIGASLFSNIEKFASYGFNKCLTGETKIITSNNKELSIHDIEKRIEKKEKVYLKSFNATSNKVIQDECIDVINTGKQEVFEIILSNNKKIKCTLNHKFLCSDLKMHTLKDIIKNNLDILECNNI